MNTETISMTMKKSPTLTFPIEDRKKYGIKAKDVVRLKLSSGCFVELTVQSGGSVYLTAEVRKNEQLQNGSILKFEVTIPTLPAQTPVNSVTTPAGLFPKVEISRKGFLKGITNFFIGASAASSLIAIVDRVIQEELKRSAYESEIMQRLFAPAVFSQQRQATILPAWRHPSLKPDGKFYKIETDVADAYNKWLISQKYASAQMSRDIPQRLEHGLVVIGSQMSNPTSTKYLGTASDHDCSFKVHSPSFAKKVEYHWNLHAPLKSPIQTFQYGEPYLAHDSMIATNGINAPIWQPKRLPRRDKPNCSYWLADYLLVTVVPRNVQGAERVVIFSGLHGPGTAAAKLFFTEPPFKELEKTLKMINYSDYYQALYSVSVGFNSKMDEVPIGIELIDAKSVI